MNSEDPTGQEGNDAKPLKLTATVANVTDTDRLEVGEYLVVCGLAEDSVLRLARSEDRE